MGIFTIKRNHKSKNKSKESTVIEGKSKSGFHFSSIFKFSNKKKQITKNVSASKDDTPLKQEQGYYFVSYQKNLEISRASSTNENNLVQNPYNNIKTIELIQTTMNPFEEKGKRISIQEIKTSRPNSIESQELKKVQSDLNIEMSKTETSEEKTACPSQVPDQLQAPTQISNEVGSSLVTCKPKHTSSMSQLGEFIEEEEEEEESFEESRNINEESKEVTSFSASYSKEKSTLLNIEGQNNIEVISDDEAKPVESVHTPSSTQATLGKDTSLTTNTFSSELIELNTSSMSEAMKTEIIHTDSIEEEVEEEVTNVNNISLTENSHEKRKRGDSQCSEDSFPESTEAFIQEKKVRKNKKRSSKDPNFVKNHKKRMGIITGSSGPIIQDTSIVQGVKGPWKIIETTTMTAGIAASPELIHQTFGSGAIAQTNHMMIRSPSLPSLKNATVIKQKLITRHQIVSDSLIEEVNGIQYKCSSPSFDDPNSISESDQDSFPFNYHNDRISNEINSFHHSDPILRKKSSPKLFIQNLKSLKAVLKHDSKKLNQNNEKRSPRMTNQEMSYPSVQSQVISTSTNSENINVNTTNTNVYSNTTPIMNSTTNVNMNPDIHSSTITTTNYNHSNHQSNSNAQPKDRNSPNPYYAHLSSPIQDELSTESPISHSFTIIKYQLNKPSYLEDEQSKVITDSHWNSDVTMKARYHMTSDYDHDKSNVSIYKMHRRPFVINTSMQMEEPSTIDTKDESKDQIHSHDDVPSQIQSKKKKSYNEELVKPILDMARKRKNVQRRKQWPKKFRSNENLGKSHNDSSANYGNMTTIVSSSKKEGDSYGHDESFYDNYYLGLSYINNEKPGEHHPNEQQPSNVNKVNDHDHENDNNDRNNDLSRITEKHEEANMIDTTFTSLEFKDTVISSVENDIASTSQPDQSTSSHKTSSSILNNSNIIHKSNSTLPLRKGRSPSLTSPSPPTISRQTYPRLIDVPGNSSMIKAYAMKNVDGNIEEQLYDSSMLTPLTNYSTAGATAGATASGTAVNDTIQSIQPQPHTTSPLSNNAIQILATQCTQKTSTYSYLPMELLESSENMNITNFQIHTCKDSVLSPLIPCIACSNENKWKNKSLTTKFRDHFKKWMVTLTHKKKGNDKSIVYSSSATLTVPIYFGDQLASPEDQNRHRSGDSSKSKRRSTSIGRTKKLKKSISASSFLFPNKATENPLPMNSYIAPTSYRPVVETKRSSEILPIAHDINKKNSSIRIKKVVKPSSVLTPAPILTSTPAQIPGSTPVQVQGLTPVQVPGSTPVQVPGSTPAQAPANTPVLATVTSPVTSTSIKPIHTLPRSERTVSLQNRLIKQKQMEKDQNKIKIRPNRKTGKTYQDRHKGIIYYTNSRKVLEKDAISHHGSAPQMSLKDDEELKRRISSSKVSAHDGYNETIFSSPITPELKPTDIDDGNEDVNPPLKSKSSNLSVSISTTTSSYSVPIQQFTTSTIPTKKSQSNPPNRHSSTFKTLYKDICVLGLSIDRLAEKYSSNLNKKK